MGKGVDLGEEAGEEAEVMAEEVPGWVAEEVAEELQGCLAEVMAAAVVMEVDWAGKAAVEIVCWVGVMADPDQCRWVTEGAERKAVPAG